MRRLKPHSFLLLLSILLAGCFDDSISLGATNATDETAEVHVVIHDGDGEQFNRTLQVEPHGYIKRLTLQLPTGDYQIRATWSDHVANESFSIPEDGFDSIVIRIGDSGLDIVFQTSG